MPTDPVQLRCRTCNTLNRVPAAKLADHPLCGQCKSPLAFPTAPITTTANNFDQELSSWPGNLLVEFWAKWCGFCRIAEPVVNDLAAWKAGRLKVIKVDIDAEPALARRFMVKATPTFLFYRNGQQAARMDGAPKEKIELVQWVEQLMR